MFSSRTRLTSTVFWCHLERVVFGRRGEKSRLLSNFHTRMWYVILCSIFWWHQNYLRYACISYTAPPLLLCILLWWLLIIAVSVLTVILAFTSSRCVFCYVYFNMLIFERTYWESVWMENSFYCLLEERFEEILLTPRFDHISQGNQCTKTKVVAGQIDWGGKSS